jgi:hypothetical protein
MESRQTIPVAFFTSFKGTCVDLWDDIQLKLCGIPLRSILANTASLLLASGNGWPVLESIRLRRVCDTYMEHVHFSNVCGTGMYSGRDRTLTCTTNWLHHKIAWCSIDNQTFFIPVLLIKKPLVGGTIPSRDSNFVLTWKSKCKKFYHMMKK